MAAKMEESKLTTDKMKVNEESLGNRAPSGRPVAAKEHKQGALLDKIPPENGEAVKKTSAHYQPRPTQEEAATHRAKRDVYSHLHPGFTTWNPSVSKGEVNILNESSQLIDPKVRPKEGENASNQSAPIPPYNNNELKKTVSVPTTGDRAIWANRSEYSEYKPQEQLVFKQDADANKGNGPLDNAKSTSFVEKVSDLPPASDYRTGYIATPTLEETITSIRDSAYEIETAHKREKTSLLEARDFDLKKDTSISSAILKEELTNYLKLSKGYTGLPAGFQSISTPVPDLLTPERIAFNKRAEARRAEYRKKNTLLGKIITPKGIFDSEADYYNSITFEEYDEEGNIKPEFLPKEKVSACSQTEKKPNTMTNYFEERTKHFTSNDDEMKKVKKIKKKVRESQKKLWKEMRRLRLIECEEEAEKRKIRQISGEYERERKNIKPKGAKDKSKPMSSRVSMVDLEYSEGDFYSRTPRSRSHKTPKYNLNCADQTSARTSNIKKTKKKTENITNEKIEKLQKRGPYFNLKLLTQQHTKPPRIEIKTAEKEKEDEEVAAVTAELKAKLVNLSRHPIICPVDMCYRMVGMSSVMSHFIYDHKKEFGVTEVFSGQSVKMSFTFGQFKFRRNQCIGIIAYGGKETPPSDESMMPGNRGICNVNAFLPAHHYHLDKYLPIMIIGCTTTWSAMLEDKDVEYAFTDPEQIERFILIIWAVSVPTTKPIHCTITAYGKTGEYSRSVIAVTRHLSQAQNVSDFLPYDSNVLRLDQAEVQNMMKTKGDHINLDIVVTEFDP